MTEPVDSAPWPVPDKTLLDLDTLLTLNALPGVAETVEEEVADFIARAPVKASPDHAAYLHDLAMVVDTLEIVLDKLKEARAAVAAALCRGVPFGTSAIAYAGLRPMIPRWGGDRTAWANELLAADVKPRLLQVLDPETKEPTGEMRGAQDVLDATLSVVSLIGSNVKTTGLKKLGLDPDDYCHKVPKDPDVQVVK